MINNCENMNKNKKISERKNIMRLNTKNEVVKSNSNSAVKLSYKS